MSEISSDKETAQAPIGVITEVHGAAAVIACDTLPPLRQALCANLDHEICLFEVHQYLDEQHVRAVTLHRSAGLHRGMAVYDTGTPLHVPVAPECLGRLLNIFGEPLDGGEALKAGVFRNIHSRPLPLEEAVGIGEVLQTGIKGIDLLCPSVKGGKTGLFGGAGVGKTVLIMEFMHAVATLPRYHGRDCTLKAFYPWLQEAPVLGENGGDIMWNGNNEIRPIL